MKKPLFLLSFLFVLNISAQQNFEWLKLKKFKVAVLSKELKETSGLSFLQGKLYTFNDGGNTSEIFEIDKKTGKILSKIKTGLQNQDWEAITNDGNNFYIGDFGNNFGARKNLSIYKIEKEKFHPTLEENNISPKDSASLKFFYPDQKDFSPNPLNTDFDAEGMIFLNGKIHIFTKEWVSKGVSHYVLNTGNSQNQPAQKVENYKIGFFVTDAYYFKHKLYLLGYTKNTEVFLTIFDEAEPEKFFIKTPRKYYLGSALTVSQIEGIAVDDDGIYISGEEFKSPLGTAKQSLYFIPKRELE